MDLDTFLSGNNPLDRQAVEYLIEYREEDDKVDYKKTFAPDLQKSWLELAKDISAFANTFGGYLVFGVQDNDKKVVGLERSVADILKESDNIQKKINRNLEPPITSIRAKEFRFDGIIVVIHIPQTKNTTHMISKDGEFTHQSGARKKILHHGTFYVRRVGGNHLGDSRDLDGVVERRVDAFRESLLDKVATVVNAPVDSEILIATKGEPLAGENQFVITNSADALEVKSMSYTIPPKTAEQEIAGMCAFHKANKGEIPSPLMMWKWYEERLSLSLSVEHRLALFKFALWVGAPVFYWINDLKAKDLRSALYDAVRMRRDNLHLSQSLEVAAFLGKPTYSKVVSMLGDRIDRVSPRMKLYPDNPRSIHASNQKPSSLTPSQFKKERLRKLNDILKECVSNSKIPSVIKQAQAIRIDSLLYARDDQYK